MGGVSTDLLAAATSLEGLYAVGRGRLHRRAWCQPTRQQLPDGMPGVRPPAAVSIATRALSPGSWPERAAADCEQGSGPHRGWGRQLLKRADPARCRQPCAGRSLASSAGAQALAEGLGTGPPSQRRSGGETSLSWQRPSSATGRPVSELELTHGVSRRVWLLLQQDLRQRLVLAEPSHGSLPLPRRRAAEGISGPMHAQPLSPSGGCHTMPGAAAGRSARPAVKLGPTVHRNSEA